MPAPNSVADIAKVPNRPAVVASGIMTATPDSAAAVNRDVASLWATRFARQPTPVHWPLICPEPVTGGLAVVGCNPAAPESGYYKIPKFQAGTLEPHLSDLPALEAAARKSYPYYAPFHRLARQLGLPWEHIDLFFFRETGQKNLLPLVADPEGELNDFGRQQVDLAARLLALAQPRIILVANAFAARVFKTHFRLKPLDDDGLYWVTLGGRKVPVFLSSMLSGARPLDSHSLERLVWHMQKTLTPPHTQAKSNCAS